MTGFDTTTAVFDAVAWGGFALIAIGAALMHLARRSRHG